MSDFDDPFNPNPGKPYGNMHNTFDNRHWRESWDYRNYSGNSYFEQEQANKAASQAAQTPTSVNTDPPGSFSYNYGDDNSSGSYVSRQSTHSTISQHKSAKVLVFCAVALSIGLYYLESYKNEIILPYGSQGPAVKVLGSFLNHCYQKDPAFRLLNDQSIEEAFSDQKFGPKVRSVVNAFKESQEGLPVDGVVDRKTLHAIRDCVTRES